MSVFNCHSFVSCVCRERTVDPEISEQRAVQRHWNADGEEGEGCARSVTVYILSFGISAVLFDRSFCSVIMSVVESY